MQVDGSVLCVGLCMCIVGWGRGAESGGSGGLMSARLWVRTSPDAIILSP
jgi:hypothetical protein